MKRFLYLLLAASMLFAYGCTGDTTTIDTPTGSDTLNGTLRDPATNAPIAGALIKNGLAWTVTDATGNWTLGGFSETTAVTNSVAPQFMVTITKLPTGYPSQVYRTVGVTQSILGPNDLTVGKLNATVRGQMLNADGSPAVGATVWLTYLTDGHSGTLSLSGIGTAYSATPSVLTLADGRYTIPNVETGSIIFVRAQSADGQRTLDLIDAFGFGNLRQLPIIDAFTTNLNVEYFGGTPDTYQQLQVTGATSVTVDTGVPPFTSSLPNGGEVPPGPSTVTFVLNRPAQQTTYTGTNYVGGQLQRDVNVNYAAKVGNIPYTVDFTTNADGDITEILVHFLTATSGIYTIDVNTVIPKMLDLNGNNGFCPVSTQVVFTTNGGIVDLAAVGHLTLFSFVNPVNHFTYIWSPVSGAKSYNVYVRVVQNFLDGTSNLHTWVRTGNTLTAQWSFQPGTDVPNVAPSLDPFTENDGVRLSYDLTVIAVNSDGLEGPPQAAGDVASVNNLPATVATTATDLSTGAALRPVGTVGAAIVAPNELTVVTAAAPPAVGQVALLAAIGTQPVAPAVPTPVAGDFTNLAGPPAHTTSMVVPITFNYSLVKSQADTLANWSIVETGTITPATTVPIVAVTPSAASAITATTDVSTHSIISVVYNPSTRTAVVTYRVGYGFSIPIPAGANDLAGTTYAVTNPALRFATTAQDLAGNSVFYGNNKGI